MFARVAALMTVAGAVTVIIGGWILDIPVLRTFWPADVQTMKVNTAAAILLCGVAAGLAPYYHRRWAYVVGLLCAALVFMIAGLTLAEYLFLIDFGIDQWLFPDRHSPVIPGRPGPNSAVGLLFLSLALVFIDYRIGRTVWLGEWFALAAAAVALLGLTGLVYDPETPQEVLLFFSISPPVAIFLMLVAAAILAARPDHGLMATVSSSTAGGYVARRLLPVALIAPPLIGWFTLYGTRAGHFDVTVGLTIFVTASVVVFMMFIWRGAKSLVLAEMIRREAEVRLQRANESLEARIAARTEELVRSNERLRAEAAERRKTEEKLRWLLESAPDAIIVSDNSGVIVLVNARTEEMFGYRREELIGKSVETLIPSRFRPNHVEFRDSYAAAPRTRMMGAGRELYALHKDGREFPVAISLSPIRIEDELLIFSDVRDVSWQRQAEHELRISEARFRAVVDTATEAVITANANGEIVYSNPAAERIFGYSADEMHNKPFAALVPPRHYRTTYLAQLDTCAQSPGTGIQDNTMELICIRKDRAEFPAELSLARWQVGESVFFTGILRDITARRQSEKHIRELNAHLAQRAAELETANRELESFSYSVSHDLRAPLRAIDGFSQVLLSDYGKALDDTGRDRLERVRRAAQNMAELINSLLKLARVTRLEMAREELDMSAIARDIVEQLKREEPHRNVRVDITPDLRATGDAHMMRIALENLLRNAWKFTGHRDDPQIVFGAERDGDEIVYFVRDNGAGFEMAFVDKLFVPFQRLHDVVDYPGTGIGLATLQRVISRHGGRVWARGAPNVGAVFYFTMGPASAGISGTIQPVSEKQSASG